MLNLFAKLGDRNNAVLRSPLPINSKVNGTTFAEGKAMLHNLYEGMSLQLQRQPDNPYDQNAVAVYGYVSGGQRVHFGYIPRDDAGQIAGMMDAGYKINCVVTAVVGGYNGCNIGLRVRLY